MKLSSTFGAIRPGSKPDNWRRIEGRQWWLSLTGVLVSLLLTLGIVSFVLPAFIPGWENTRLIQPGCTWPRGFGPVV